VAQRRLHHVLSADQTTWPRSVWTELPDQGRVAGAYMSGCEPHRRLR
jgi:hypothetical protein